MIGIAYLALIVIDIHGSPVCIGYNSYLIGLLPGK